jgi:hypothetical protein
MARVRLTPEGPRLDSFPVLAKLPPARTGGNIKRWFRLSAQLGDDFVCRLERPFSSDLGWGTLNFLLLFNPATQSWSQLVPGQEGLRRVEVEASLEEYARAVGGGELLVWVDAQGKLRTKVDDTPYFMEGSRPPSDVQAAYREERAAGEAARRHHQLEMEDGGETYAQEPWGVRAPADAAFQPVHLYGVRQALFEHHPHLGPEEVEEIRCRGAHRLKGPDGRMSLIFFVDARRHLGDWVYSCLVTRLP